MAKSKAHKTHAMYLTLALIGLVGVTACNGETQPDPAGAGLDAEQTLAPQPQQDIDPEMMALVMEAQELQQQLAPTQQAALQDEALGSQLEDLQERIDREMRAEAPELFEQMEQLEADFMAAQAAGDEARTQEIGMQAQLLGTELQILQEEVLDRPGIREPVDAFEEAHRERMIEIDPRAGELLDRMEEIQAELQMP